MTELTTSLAVRAAFCAVILGLPLQMVVREYFSEPYPGLYQPSFGGAPVSSVQATTLEPDITVVDTAGRATAVSPSDLLPVTPSLNATVFRTAFYDPAQADDPETRRWLRLRAAMAVPGTDPEVVRILWQDVEYDYATGVRRVAGANRTVLIDVSAPGAEETP